MRSLVSAELGLDNSTSSGGEQTYIDLFLNEGVVDFLKETRCFWTSTTLSITASDTTLSSTVMLISHLYYPTSPARALHQVTPEEILNMRANGSGAGVPLYYALAGSSLLMLHPQVSGTVSLSAYYTPYPTAMSASADTPSATANGGIPAEFHQAIVDYALWKLARYDQSSRTQNGHLYELNYREAVARANRDVSSKGGRGPAPARTWRNRVPFFAANDVYPR